MWPDSAQTAELLARARDGDAAAVERLLAGHREALRRMVQLRMDPALARRVDSSDVVQEVLIEANRRLTDYLARPAMPFALWLRSMARDRLIDAHRRHREAARRSLDREQPLAGGDDSSTAALQPGAWLADRELTPAAAALQAEAARRFQEALAQLDETDREVLLMRHFEQLSNQEVATALGLSEAAASMRHLRAIKRLRASIGQAVPEEAGE
ncbi:MAG: sigma-70 family RNA polymerase sigma factor [Pirellulales bacterium]|nr:sigma-70 family RNA polymerase sigma factor [Pirellulales bacterium]